MSKNIKRFLLCGLCIAAILLLAFGADMIVTGSGGSRGKGQVCLLYEKAPAKDRSEHREEDFDPAGKRVIWRHIPGEDDLNGDFGTLGHLSMTGMDEGLVWQYCNENAWFAVSIWEGFFQPADHLLQRFRKYGAYVSVGDKKELVGFMTGSQIRGLTEWDTELWVGIRSRPTEEYEAELAESNDPLQGAQIIPASSVSWRVEAYSLSRYYGSLLYTGPLFHISTLAELETAIACAPMTEREAARWRQNYNQTFFEQRDLIVFRIGFGRSQDLVPARVEKAGDELRVILSKASTFYVGGENKLLFVELPKHELNGIKKFSLRIGEPQEKLITEEDFPLTVTPLGSDEVWLQEISFRLLGPDLQTSVNIPQTEVRERYLKDILAQRWLTDEQREQISREWRSRYTEEFLQSKWMVMWQIELPGPCSGTEIEEAALYSRELKTASGIALRGRDDRYYEVRLKSGKSDPENGVEIVLVVMELPLNMVDKFDIYLDGVKVATNRYKRDITVTEP